MVEGGKVAEGIIAKAVKDLFRVVAKDVEKDAAKDVGRSVEKDLARTLEKDLGKDLEKDLEKDVGRDLDSDVTKGVDDRVLCGDPVDVATGEVVMHQVDMELPGVLPLLLSRTHSSSYRRGRLFGPSWSSTLDQRLEVDAAGVVFVADEAMVLHYPRPGLDEHVLPERGPRWPLTLTAEGTYTVRQPEHGRTLHFTRLREGLDRLLVSIIDRNGNRIDIDRDPDGTPTLLRHSGGYRIAVDSEAGLVTVLRLLAPDTPDGITLLRFSYGPGSRLAQVVNSSGLPMTYDYDPDGRLTGWQDRNGAWYRYTYDERGRCVRATGRDGYLDATFAYDDERRVTVVTDSLGHATTYHLDDRGRVVREVDPLGHATLSEWDDRDRLVARTDPLGHTTRHAYDTDGNLVETVRPDGTHTRATYDQNGNAVQLTQPDGAVWRQEFDARGNLTALTDPTGATTHYTYDEHGALARATDPLGNAWLITNDAAGLPVEVVEPGTAVTRLVRDAFGRVTVATDPAGNTTEFGRTVEGLLVWCRLPDGSTQRWSYDGEGNLVEYVDAAGNVTRTEYTSFDLPVAQSGPDGARLAMAYDTELRLVAVSNPQGLVWHYEYDAAGNLVRETDFDGSVTTYTYDPAGRLASRTNAAGQAVHLIRDALGNVVEQRSGETVTRFAYDGAGRLVRATSQVADLVLSRDAAGRVVAETCNGRTVASTYDPAGRRVARHTPTGARSEWEYDANHQPVTLTTAGRTVRFGYDAAGREVARRIDADVLLTQTWDPKHQLRTQTLSAGGLDPTVPPAARSARLLQHRAYAYRADGTPTSVEDRMRGTRRFELDPAGRVTAVHGAGWTERYAHDPAGNIVHAAWPVPPHADSLGAAAVGDRQYAGTLVRRAGAVRYEHDARGRLVSRHHRTLSGQPRTWQYAWDAEDRLVAVTTPDGTVWRYLYDPLGRRIAKQRLTRDRAGIAEQVDFAWDGTVLAEQVHTVYGPDGPTVRATTWDWEPSAFRPVVQAERAPLRNASQQWIDERFYAIVTDLVGTPSEMVTPDGDVVWQARDTLWGCGVAPARPGPSCPLRFPGQYLDAESGLHYNYYRYYDPASGRYGSGDPLGLDGGPAPRSYVDNPLAALDPLGLVKCTKAEMQAMMLSQSIAPDLLDKGVHFNVGKLELRVAPTNEGTLVLKPVHPGMAGKNLKKFEAAINKGYGALEYPEFRKWLMKHARAGMELAPMSGEVRHHGKVREFKALLRILSRM